MPTELAPCLLAARCALSWSLEASCWTCLTCQMQPAKHGRTSCDAVPGSSGLRFPGRPLGTAIQLCARLNCVRLRSGDAPWPSASGMLQRMLLCDQAAATLYSALAAFMGPWCNTQLASGVKQPLGAGPGGKWSVHLVKARRPRAQPLVPVDQCEHCLQESNACVALPTPAARRCLRLPAGCGRCAASWPGAPDSSNEPTARI